MTRLLMALLVAGLAAPALAQDAAGLVVARRGQITAYAADGTPRSVTCGDLIREDERLETAHASRVALLTGDVYAQLYVLSSARFGAAPDGASRLALERGRMRVIDPRASDSAKDVLVTASDTTARFHGNDVDAYVLGPAGETNSMICAERVDLVVDRASGGGDTARLGECVVSSQAKPLYRAQIPSTRIGLEEAYECELPIADRAMLAFSPDVAAGPEPPLPGALGGPNRDSCDVPGSGCGALPSSGDPVDVITPFPSDPLPGLTVDQITPFPSDPLP